MLLRRSILLAQRIRLLPHKAKWWAQDKPIPAEAPVLKNVRKGIDPSSDVKGEDEEVMKTVN